MKKKHQVYLRLNLMSIFLIAVSFISVTLAWFAYSGLSTVSTEVDVKAWYIEIEKDGEKVSNNIKISLADIYPGMDLVTEVLKIKNPGDSDAEVKYSIVSARILGDSDNNYIINDTITSDYVEDLLAHEFPFNVNINLSKNYILSKGEESVFEISVSWPLDSGADIVDSEWGNKAYNFQMNEAEKKKADSHYKVQPSIQIEISLTAEQYMENSKSSDPDYNLGDEILVDVVNNSSCDIISPTCIKMYVLDKNNTLGDSNITLLPNPYGTYESSTYDNYQNIFSNLTSTWQVTTRGLLIEDLLKIISTDVTESVLQRDDISDALIGSLKYPDRISKELDKAINGNGTYKFINQKFPYLISADCYWTQSEYNLSNAFALVKENNDSAKIYGNAKNNTCKIIPIVIMDKSKLKR